jgi:hypothetical protein
MRRRDARSRPIAGEPSPPASSGDARLRGVSTDGGPCLSPGTVRSRVPDWYCRRFIAELQNVYVSVWPHLKRLQASERLGGAGSEHGPRVIESVWWSAVPSLRYCF